MKAKENKTDKPKRGMVEASEEEQKYFESYPDKTRLTLKEVLDNSREKSKLLVK